jgi:hypothetical protein
MNFNPDLFASAVFNRSPSGFYRMSTLSGTAEPDLSVSQNADGVYSGDFTLGQRGAILGSSDTAVAFGGTTSKLTLGHPVAFDLTTSGSIVIAWKAAALPAINTQALFLGKDTNTGQSYAFGIIYELASGHLRLGAMINGAIYLSNYTPTLDGLFHLGGMTINNGLLAFYNDGLPVGTVNAPTPNVSTSDLVVGARGYPGFEARFNGVLDELAIWKGTVLSDADMTALNNARLALTPDAHVDAASISAIAAAVVGQLRYESGVLR